MTRDIATDWLVANPKVNQAEELLASLTEKEAAQAMQSLQADIPASQAAKKLRDDARLELRTPLADCEPQAAQTAACIVLTMTAWLVSQIRNNVSATELAMHLFGLAADLDGEYYDSCGFIEKFSYYEKDAERVLTDIGNGRTLTLTQNKRLPQDDKYTLEDFRALEERVANLEKIPMKVIYNQQFQSGSNSTVTNSPTTIEKEIKP